jgi:PAS domain S-box-containing protein
MSTMRLAVDRAMLSTPMHDWSIQQVAAFLQQCGVESAVVTAAAAEMISGVELLDMTGDDLKELGMAQMGPRKKLLARIAKVRDKGLAAMLDDGSVSSVAATHEDSSETSSANVVQVTALFKTQTHRLPVTSSVSLEKLLLNLSQLCNVRVKIKLQDEDGDQIAITSDEQLRDALIGEEAITLQCIKDLKWAPQRAGASPAVAVKSGSAVVATPDAFAYVADLLDAFVVIDGDGTVVAFNAAAEKMFQFAARKVVGKNVKMLMPHTYAKKHDTYLAKYARSGIKNVIDKKRTVMAKTSDDEMFAIELGVTEKEVAGAAYFIGCIRRANDDDSSAASASASHVTLDKKMRRAFEALLEAAVVISAEGVILLFNQAAEKLLGYSAAEAVGQPVELLMASPHKENHAKYLQRFVATGEKHVIGSSRDVQALHKNGSLVNVTLALSEQHTSADDQIFVGLLSLNKTIAHKTSSKAAVVARASSLLQMTRNMIASLTIPAILINEAGIIQAFNRAAEKLLGFALVDVIGRNVTILMGDDDAAKHDGYLARFLTTRDPHVIGKERVVEARTKTGRLIEVQLAVTESQDDAGKSLFTGMLHRTKAEDAAATARRKKTKKKSKESSTSLAASSSFTK